MKLSISLPKEPGTFGAWLSTSDNQSDVHVYTHNETHEGSGVVIGCNPTYETLRFTDPALILLPNGTAKLQFADDRGEMQTRDLMLSWVSEAILKMLGELKAKAKR